MLSFLTVFFSTAAASLFTFKSVKVVQAVKELYPVDKEKNESHS